MPREPGATTLGPRTHRVPDEGPRQRLMNVGHRSQEIVWGVPGMDRPVTNRGARLATTITATVVLIVLWAYACSVAGEPPTGVRLGPPLGPTAYGNDISWPQYPKRVGGYGLPGPTSNASFAVLGLTDGGSLRANPCLASQVESVNAAHLWAGAYAIVTYPTDAQLARHGGNGTLLSRLGRVGAAQAGFNLSTMARVGLRSPMVWMDIEPSTRSPWSTSAVNNNAVIDGVVAGYKTAGVRVGIYSYNRAWKAITGSRLLPGLASWVTVGHQGQRVAAASCALVSYSGSKPWLVQWASASRDYDLTCPGATRWAASATS